MNVDDLRYSQRGCSECFTCGRSVWQLVRDLERGNVRLSAPFLRLTVFETRDERTEQTVLRCIDNRRLYALKGVRQEMSKIPIDGERQPVQLQYIHADAKVHPQFR